MLLKFTIDEYREGNKAVRETSVFLCGMNVYTSKCTSTDNTAVHNLTEISNDKSNIKKIVGFK